jgi:PTH1 family peptidyl-tRNA hydrolase
MSYLLIGLGNPTKKFDSTRHNVGKMFVGWLKQVQESTKKYNPPAGGVQEGELEVVETECFMNESGGWVKNKMATMAEMAKMVKNSSHFDHSNHYNHLFISHDDLDIPLGKFKIQFGKGPRLHNGVLSVEQALGTKEFWRIRIGIDSRLTGQQGEDYVLERFKPDEKKILEAVFPEIRDRLLEDFKGT